MESKIRSGRSIENVIVPFAPTGQRIPAQGIALGTASQRMSVLKEHRIGKDRDRKPTPAKADDLIDCSIAQRFK